MDQRRRFVLEWRSGSVSKTALCQLFGISRQTAYKWLGRYLDAQGRIEALADRSRRPLSSPDANPTTSSTSWSRPASYGPTGNR